VVAADTGVVTFVVTYANAGDVVKIDTIDNNDILVTGPNSFSQPATLVSKVANGDGSQVVATYKFDVGGAWDATNSGTYYAHHAGQRSQRRRRLYVVSGVLLSFNPGARR